RRGGGRPAHRANVIAHCIPPWMRRFPTYSAGFLPVLGGVIERSAENLSASIQLSTARPVGRPLTGNPLARGERYLRTGGGGAAGVQLACRDILWVVLERLGGEHSGVLVLAVALGHAGEPEQGASVRAVLADRHPFLGGHGQEAVVQVHRGQQLVLLALGQGGAPQERDQALEGLEVVRPEQRLEHHTEQRRVRHRQAARL